MADQIQENQANQTQVETKQNDKELNFRMLEAKYEKQLAQERAARLEAEKQAQEALTKKQQASFQEEEDDNEPYVDHKKLNKTLNKFSQNTQSDIQKAVDMAKKQAKEELKQEMFIDQNKDFYDVLQKHAEKFAEKAPHLADAILNMPEGFERQKLVYHNIKMMGLDKPEQKTSTIQDKIDSNKKGLYYQPSGIGTAPYAQSSDFSAGGQKQAYSKMQELKSRLRLS